MFDSRKELLDKIRLGEDSFLEFKEIRFSGSRVSQPSRQSFADELAAFANSRGGVIVLGVEDDTREILGIPLDRIDNVERYVHEICQDSITPVLAPVIERMWLPNSDGKDVAVIKVEVTRSLFVHRSPGGYWHRVGSAKRVMSPDYLERLFQQRSQTRLIRFDEQIVPDASLDDLEPELWSRFATPRTGDARDVLLTKLGMARAGEDGEIKPTVSGILMASGNPRQWIPNAYIQAVAYRGQTISTGAARDPYQLDAADFVGPLDGQIADACEFVDKNMKIAASKEMGRSDKPQFDMSAVFEAVVNAAAHRDYSIPGSKTRLRVFSDRLELYSPGGLPNTMDVESLVHLQSSRNEVLTSLLAKCPVPNMQSLTTDRSYLMDKRGEGVRIILDNSEKLSGREPKYQLVGESELFLTIYGSA